jgi:L-ascorbate metabolism protein UlaG (beta-lactamase superfamily)
MKIKWLGHSSFMITSDSGVRIVTDPYEPGSFGGAVMYGKLTEPAEVVTVSHEHSDHNFVKMVPGNPMILRNAGEFAASGIEFHGVGTSHDKSSGNERGRNVVFTFVVDGIKVCHLGDLGHVLTDEQCSLIGAVDVLFAPVGGHFTVGPDEAWKIAEQLSAKIVIPMHYKTESVEFPIGNVEEFTRGKPNVKQLNSSSFEIIKEDLPEERTIVVLQHAL